VSLRTPAAADDDDDDDSRSIVGPHDERVGDETNSRSVISAK